MGSERERGQKPSEKKVVEPFAHVPVAFRCWLTRLKRQTKDRQSDRRRSEEKRQICERKGQTCRQAGAQTQTRRKYSCWILTSCQPHRVTSRRQKRQTYSELGVQAEKERQAENQADQTGREKYKQNRQRSRWASSETSRADRLADIQAEQTGWQADRRRDKEKRQTGRHTERQADQDR